MMVPVRMFRLIALGLAVCFTPPAMAQTLQDGAAKIRPLAERGDAKWQYFLGTCYEVGIGGVERDYAEALKWLRKAAEQGYPDAFGDMAYMYAGGFGVPKNYVLAAMYVELAETRHVTGIDFRMTRTVVSKHVTAEQTAEAKKRAAECARANFKGCEKI